MVNENPKNIKRMAKQVFLITFVLALLLAGCNQEAGDAGVFSHNQDVGDCKIPGTLEYNAGDSTYIISGSGDNIWFGSDDFHFAWFRNKKDVTVRSNI